MNLRGHCNQILLELSSSNTWMDSMNSMMTMSWFRSQVGKHPPIFWLGSSNGEKFSSASFIAITKDRS